MPLRSIRTQPPLSLCDISPTPWGNLPLGGTGGCGSCGSLPDTATAIAIAGPVRSPAPICHRICFPPSGRIHRIFPDKPPSICGSPVGTGVRGSPVSGLPFRMEAFREIPAATIATIATVIYTVSFSPLRPSQPSHSGET